MEEIETSLGGDAIATLEELEVEEDHLRQVKESLEKSASLMDTIINEEPKQTEAMKDAETSKSVQAESKIRACKKRLAGFRGMINASKAASTAAAVPATTESTAAPTTRPLIGPRFER